jgi:hypothetical protein
MFWAGAEGTGGWAIAGGVEGWASWAGAVGGESWTDAQIAEGNGAGADEVAGELYSVAVTESAAESGRSGKSTACGSGTDGSWFGDDWTCGVLYSVATACDWSTGKSGADHGDDAAAGGSAGSLTLSSGVGGAGRSGLLEAEKGTSDAVGGSGSGRAAWSVASRPAGISGCVTTTACYGLDGVRCPVAGMFVT